MKIIKVELFLGIGYSQGTHKEIITVTDEDCDIDNEEELEAYLQDYLNEWSCNYIDSGWTVQDV